jgi:hypothetical protein
LRFIDDAEELIERVNIRLRPSRLDEVSVVSLPAAGPSRDRWLTAGAEIHIHHHARRSVWPARFAQDLAQERVHD